MSEDKTLDEFASAEEPAQQNKIGEWVRLPIKEISKWTDAGGTPRTSNEEYWGGHIPWVQTGELTKRHINSTEKHITELGLEESAAKRFPPDTLLIGMYGEPTVGESALLETEATTNQACCGVFPDTDMVNAEFLHQSMQYEKPRLYSLRAGSGQQNIRQGIIRKFEIGIPPLPEQRKIATVLYTVDRAIEKTEEIISKKEEVKRGLMQDIFRYGVDSDGQIRSTGDTYQETKYGPAPEEWKIVRLEDIVPDDASITYGIVKPGDHYPGGVPVVKVENITNGEVQTGDLLHTDPEIHQKYDRAELKQGDLLFTIRGTVGRMAFVPASLEGGNLTQDTARIRVEDANPSFIRYYLETATPHNYFERHTKGQAVQGINLEDLQQVPVHLPHREEQKRIVDILDSHTQQIQKEREYHDQLKRLKRGLMQDLLSGTVRTTDTNIEVPDEITQYG